MKHGGAPIHDIDDRAAALSIDFIAGFTIFLVVFILAITMVSGLLVGLQSKTIDYDAVAYRTGVILTEDPGETVGYNSSWEDYSVPETMRFGLAVSRDYPNVVSYNKVEKFFNSENSVIQEKTMMFREGNSISDYYPYRFNISISELNGNKLFPPVGDPYPDKYGYTRRIVKIMGDGITRFEYLGVDGSKFNNGEKSFIVNIYDQDIDERIARSTLYGMDPYKNGVIINITNINNGTDSALTGISVEGDVTSSGTPTFAFGEQIYPITSSNLFSVDNQITSNSVNLTILPGFPSFDQYNQSIFYRVKVNYSFSGNTSFGGTTWYDFASVTQPANIITSAVMEIRVW